MRSPSERLIQTLTDSGLCTRAEIDQCEPLVRVLCHDLPDFDSVWLDALVQQNSLTPWQAEQLQEPSGTRISVGRFHLSNPLGQHTWLATEPGSPKMFVLRKVPATGFAAHANLERRMSELLASLSKSRNDIPASLSIPLESLVTEPAPAANQADTVGSAGIHTENDFAPERYVRAHYVPGWSMDELLIRGGRLPVDVVAEIGRELLTALAWLESCGLLHGDITLRNVRIDDRGQTHIVDPFVRRLAQPHLAITDRLTLRDTEGVAPELVGTGRQLDSRSELYALGCVLWQLLTTRPVVLSADPVTRLMKQKEQDIPDVRTWIPDCPEWLARLIQAMTRRTPELRPTSASEALRQWRQFSGSSLSASRRLVATIPDRHSQRQRKPATAHRRKRFGFLWPASAAAALAMCVILAARSGILPSRLTLDRLAAWAKPDRSDNAATTPVQSPLPTGPVPLPAVDADGRIVLRSGVQYIAARRDFPGTLQILCESEPCAVIEIAENAPWILSGRTVDLRGIKLIQQSPRSSNDPAVSDPDSPIAQQLLAVQCATLNLQRCIVQSPSSRAEFVGVEWHRPRGSEGVVTVSDSVFAGGGYGVSLNHPPRRLELSNVLISNRGGGILTEFQKSDSETWDVSLRNVTQRFGFSLLDAIVHNDGIRSLSLNVMSAECAFAPQTAVVRIKTPNSWRSEQIKASFRAAESGNPAVIPPHVLPVVYIDPSLAQAVALPESQLLEEELLPAELHFDDEQSAAPNSSKTAWAGSKLEDFDGPKLTDRMPGVISENLPSE